MTLAVGDLAPDFTLPDSEFSPVTLSSFRGSGSVTLVFVSFAFSEICDAELCEIRDHRSLFDGAGSTVLAITCDRPQTLKAWKAQQGLDVTLLSDGWPHGEVSTAYGCFNDVAGCAERLTVVVDAEGRISAMFRSGGIGEARDFAEYTAALGG